MILALCSSCRRRLGDHLAGTLVVSADSLPALSRRSSRPWLRLSILAILCASFVAFCLSFDYYGRPPLVIQGLANDSGSASIFTDRGTIIDLTLSQPTWQANTVTYTMTFQALGHGTMSNCQGHMTLRWSGFVNGWGDSSGETTCYPIASRVSAASAISNALPSAISDRMSRLSCSHHVIKAQYL